MKTFGLLIASFLFLFPSTLAAQFQSVRVQVVDVGQGDGILIRTPNVEWVLIDAGETSILGDSLPTYFDVDSLALVIASHRHEDHIGGMDEVVRNVPVDLFVGDTVDRDVDFDDEVWKALREERIEVGEPSADTLEVDGVRFIILPWEQMDSHNENNNSVVVRMEHGDFSMLFTGDAETRERKHLVATVPQLLDVQVLKASHHGSNNGTSEAWLEAISPERVVISSGVHGRYTLPDSAAVAEYEEATDGRLYCTNRHGTVRVYGFPDGRVRVFRQRPQEKDCTYDGTHY